MFETKNHFSSCMLDFIRQSLGFGVDSTRRRVDAIYSLSPWHALATVFNSLTRAVKLLLEPSGEGLHFSSGSEVTCTPCDMRPKSKLKHCEKIWNKSCTFTAHIKITPKNFRSKFEIYIEKQKRETQMWIVYIETQIWIRELFMTDFSFFSRCMFRIWIWNF
jgi:hypothetical protein